MVSRRQLVRLWTRDSWVIHLPPQVPELDTSGPPTGLRFKPLQEIVLPCVAVPSRRVGPGDE